MKEEHINSIDELENLEEQEKEFALTSGNPDYGEEFNLWRGMKDASFELISSLQHSLICRYASDWKGHIKVKEQESLEQFLRDIEPHLLKLKCEYSWAQHLPCPKTDTVWYLSVMQHYGFPTRMMDFTADFWTAVFMATDGADCKADMCLHRLRCVNADSDDSGGNKLPRDKDGAPWRNEAGDVDINQFLGRLIGYREDYPLLDSTEEKQWESPRQGFGWERPAMMNARVMKQRGFFVYAVDPRHTLHDIPDLNNKLEKYVIEASLLPKIREKLRSEKKDSWLIYLDLDRAFKEFKLKVIGK